MTGKRDPRLKRRYCPCCERYYLTTTDYCPNCSLTPEDLQPLEAAEAVEK